MHLHNRLRVDSLKQTLLDYKLRIFGHNITRETTKHLEATRNQYERLHPSFVFWIDTETRITWSVLRKCSQPIDLSDFFSPRKLQLTSKQLFLAFYSGAQNPHADRI